MRTISLVSFSVVAATLLLPCVAQADSANGKPATESTALINIELKDVPVAAAITALFRGTPYSYYAEPGVSGRIVELKLTGITFEQALKALTDAAELTYTVEGGTYIISPRKPAAKTAASQPVVKPDSGRDQQPPASNPNQPPTEPAAQAESSNSQVMINEQPAPVYYGQPGPAAYSPYGYGYGGYPPVYQFGNTQVIPGWGGSVVVAGGMPYTVGWRHPPPPPADWVSPDRLRFLRNRYILQPTFGWSPYGW